MIQSKADYKKYYEQDLKATGIYDFKLLKRLCDRRFKFYKSLRLTEYYTNCKKSLPGKIVAKLLRMRHAYLCDKYAWTIPINVFAGGLTLVHTGTIVVSGKAKIGENCRIHVCVNIGDSILHDESGAPTIGNNVYIGPGAKIFGPITIGDNTAIGANAVVNQSFPEGNYTIAGVPARVVSKKNSDAYLIKY